jgi:peptidoglycan/LPS O-acetylase OafA/YrhL
MLGHCSNLGHDGRPHGTSIGGALCESYPRTSPTSLLGAPLVLAGRIPLQGLVLTPLLLHTFDMTAWDFVQTFDGPLWTLAIEWQFYLILPALALGMRYWARHRGERQAIWFSLALLVLTGFAIRAFAEWLHYGGGIAAPLDAPGAVGIVVRLLYGVKGRYLDSFAVGVVLAVAHVLWLEPARWSRNTRRRLSLVAVLSGYLFAAG